MNKSDYDKLVEELKRGCGSFHPLSGPHNPHDVHHYFGEVQINEARQNASLRAASLETLERQDFAPDQLAKAIKRENQHYDKRQQVIDHTIGDAERSTCLANGIPIPEQLDRPERAEQEMSFQRSNDLHARRASISTSENLSRDLGLDRTEQKTAVQRSDDLSARRVTVYTSDARKRDLRNVELRIQNGRDQVDQANHLGDGTKLPPQRLLKREPQQQPEELTAQLKANPPSLGDGQQNPQRKIVRREQRAKLDGPTRDIGPGEQHRIPGRYARERDPDGYTR